ncbi:MAG TPA: hypothetical protein VIX90_14590 [Edaphobacter sp.]
MRLCLVLFCCTLVASAPLIAESKNPSDYPLRIHIFPHDQTAFYHNRNAEEFKGDGRANLFANGDVHAIDFTFDCSEKLKTSFGYETYPAKWKKPNQELTVLLPVFGKTNAYFTCNLKTDIKDFTYLTHDGRMSSEPPAQFKAWMVKHDYDPEHGKNSPVKLESQPTASTQPAAAQQ